MKKVLLFALALSTPALAQTMTEPMPAQTTMPADSMPMTDSTMPMTDSTVSTDSMSMDTATESAAGDAVLAPTPIMNTMPAGDADLPESARAVRAILAQRGLLNAPAPTNLASYIRGAAAPATTAPAPATDAATTAPGMTDTTSATGTMQGTDMQSTGSQGNGMQSTDMQTADTQEGDILGALRDDGRFSIFLGLLDTAGDELKAAILSDEYTLLVPTDEAFGMLDPLQVAALTANPELLQLCLSNHVIPGKVTLDGSQALTSVLGNELTDISSGTDAIEAGMTRAYAIDRVLVPQDVLDALQ